jgi:hypothetical protein
MRSKNKRTYNARLFRSRRVYSFSEIAESLDTHIRTVQRWKREGLKIHDEETRPFLVMGKDLQDFLRARSRSRKRPLQPGEFYCPRCRKQTKSVADRIEADFTGKFLGRVYKQVLLRGVCEKCGQSLLLFSSDKKLADLRKIGLTFTEHRPALNGNDDSSVNADMSEGH